MGREGNSSAPGWVTSEEAAFNTIVKRCVPEKKEKKMQGHFEDILGQEGLCCMYTLGSFP
jgi:hypothetical protein